MMDVRWAQSLKLWRQPASRKNNAHKTRGRNRRVSREPLLSRLVSRFVKGGSRLVMPVCLLAIGLLLGVYGFPYLESRVNQPVERVVVEGDLQYLDRREVIEVVPIYQGDRLLDISLQGLQAEIEAMPWIFSAQVSRQWPGTIRIQLQEHKPIARWNEDQLLNQYGQLFDRQGKVINHLPALKGIAGSERNVMERYLEFSRLLAPLYLRIVELRLDQQLAWQVTLDNGVTVEVGSMQATERMKRFVYLYREKLAKSEREIVSVDLRYNSGAAVQWRDAAGEAG